MTPEERVDAVTRMHGTRLALVMRDGSIVDPMLAEPYASEYRATLLAQFYAAEAQEDVQRLRHELTARNRELEKTRKRAKAAEAQAVHLTALVQVLSCKVEDSDSQALKDAVHVVLAKASEEGGSML